MRLLAPMNSAARPFTDATACVCLSSIRPQTDELVVVVAIEVRGARAPARALPGKEEPHPAAETKLHKGAGVYATGVGKPSALGPAFSFKASVNSCKLETICGALVNTVEASFSA